MLIDFDVTPGFKFLTRIFFFLENGKSLFIIKKKFLFLVQLLLAHISVSLLVLITFRFISALS